MIRISEAQKRSSFRKLVIHWSSSATVAIVLGAKEIDPVVFSLFFGRVVSHLRETLQELLPCLVLNIYFFYLIASSLT